MLAMQLTVQIQSTASLKEAAHFSKALVSNYRCVKYFLSKSVAIVFLLHDMLQKLVSFYLGLRAYVGSWSITWIRNSVKVKFWCGISHEKFKIQEIAQIINYYNNFISDIQVLH